MTSPDHSESVFVRWVNTFELPSACNSLQDLADGVILSHVFQQIDSKSFSVLGAVGDNTLLRYGNLRRLLTAVKTFTEKELGMDVTTDLRVPGGGIDGSVLTADIVMLVHLALVCAIRCENKAMFVPSIMQFAAQDQQVLMAAIQETEGDMVPVGKDDDSLGKGSNYDIDDDWVGESNLRALDNAAISELMGDKEELAKTVDELKAKLMELERERLDWQARTKNLQNELALQTPGRNASHNEIISSQLEDELREQIEELEYTLSQKELEVSKLKKTLTEETDRRKKLEEELEIITDETKELKTLRKKLQQMEQQLKDKDTAIDQLMSVRQENETIKQELTKTRDELKTKTALGKKAQQFEMQVLELQAELDTKDKALKKAIDTRKQLERDLINTTEQLQQAQETNQRFSIRVNEGESLADINFDNSVETANVGSPTPTAHVPSAVEESRLAELTDLQQQLDDMKERFKSELRQRHDLTSQLDDLKEQQLSSTNEMKQAITKLEAENVRLQKSYETAHQALTSSANATASVVQQKEKDDDELEKLRERYQRLSEACKTERRLLMAHFYAIAKATHPATANNNNNNNNNTSNVNNVMALMGSGNNSNNNNGSNTNATRNLPKPRMGL